MKKVIVGIVICSVILAAATWVYGYWQDMRARNNPAGQNQANSQNSPVSVKKGVKRFTLAAVADSGVRGDGSMTLKTDLTSVGARLIAAPKLASGEQYEAYAKQTDGTLVLLGKFIPVESKTEVFLFGGAADVSVYDVEKLVVTKRGTGAQPGTIVAEAAVPTVGEAVQ